MPKVGSKHYSYTPKGMAAAKAAAKRKGVKMKTGKDLSEFEKPQYKRKGGMSTKKKKK